MSTKKHKKTRTVLDKKNLAVIVTATAFVAFIAFALSILLPGKNDKNDKNDKNTFDTTAFEEAIPEAEGVTGTGESGLTSVYTEEAVATVAQALPSDADEKTDETGTSAVGDSGRKAFSHPIGGEIINDYSGDELVYSETMKDWRTHNGIDYAASPGDIVAAAADGTIEAVTDSSMMGTTVIMLHSGGIRTIYSNLQEKTTAEVGTDVPAGTAIGAVGDTAALEVTMPPHLHFEMSLNEETVNPHEYLK